MANKKPGRKPLKEVKAVQEKQKAEVLAKLREFRYDVTDVDIADLIPNVFNGVLIRVVDGRSEISLPDDMIREKYNAWKYKSRGGLFAKDVHRHCIGREHGQYVILESGDQTRVLARLVGDGEMGDLSSVRLIDGKVGDKAFTIMKHVAPDEDLTTTDRSAATQGDRAPVSVQTPEGDAPADKAPGDSNVPLLEK